MKEKSVVSFINHLLEPFEPLRASDTVSRELTLGATLSVRIPAKRHIL